MASKRRLRRKQCDGKRQYTTRELAQEAATQASRRIRQRLSEYACHFGGHFHIGHPPRSRNAMFARKRRAALGL